jgi:hypothetical protein
MDFFDRLRAFGQSRGWAGIMATVTLPIAWYFYVLLVSDQFFFGFLVGLLLSSLTLIAGRAPESWLRKSRARSIVVAILLILPIFAFLILPVLLSASIGYLFALAYLMSLAGALGVIQPVGMAVRGSASA